MSRYLFYIVIGFTILAMSGCFGEDDPVQPFTPDGTTVDRVTLNPRYDQQVYYSLLSQQVTASNSIEDYELVFACMPNDYAISTNPAMLLDGVNLGKLPIDTPLDYSGVTPLYLNGDSLPFRQELYTGNVDDLIIGQWHEESNGVLKSKDNLYILSLGLDRRSEIIGYFRLKIDSADVARYYIRIANLKADSIIAVEIPRKPFINNIMYKIGEGVKEIEPPSEDWDLFFTRFNDKTPDVNLDSFDYAVVGTLINPKRIKSQDVIEDFSSFSLTEAQTVTFTDSMHVIGYDWKTFDLEASIYYYRDSLIFPISTAEGIYYKFRFLSFLDDGGQKGTPVFEYIKL